MSYDLWRGLWAGAALGGLVAHGYWFLFVVFALAIATAEMIRARKLQSNQQP